MGAWKRRAADMTQQCNEKEAWLFSLFFCWVSKLSELEHENENMKDTEKLAAWDLINLRLSVIKPFSCFVEFTARLPVTVTSAGARVKQVPR